MPTSPLVDFGLAETQKTGVDCVKEGGRGRRGREGGRHGIFLWSVWLLYGKCGVDPSASCWLVMAAGVPGGMRPLVICGARGVLM